MTRNVLQPLKQLTMALYARLKLPLAVFVLCIAFAAPIPACTYGSGGSQTATPANQCHDFSCILLVGRPPAHFTYWDLTGVRRCRVPDDLAWGRLLVSTHDRTFR